MCYRLHCFNMTIGVNALMHPIVVKGGTYSIYNKYGISLNLEFTVKL